MIIRHIMSLGSNCDGLHFLRGIANDIRIPGPVDNCLGVIVNIKYVLNGNLLNEIREEKVEFENTEPEHPEQYITIFKTSRFAIIHNKFKELKYKIEIRERFLNLYSHIYNSQFDQSLWFVISISPFDESIDLLYDTISSMPAYIKNKLIILQGRENPNFGLIHNIKEYPVFNIYDRYKTLYEKHKTEYDVDEWEICGKELTMKMTNEFLEENLTFYNRLNKTNWKEIKLYKEA